MTRNLYRGNRALSYGKPRKLINQYESYENWKESDQKDRGDLKFFLGKPPIKVQRPSSFFLRKTKKLTN